MRAGQLALVGAILWRVGLDYGGLGFLTED
jgi:hypothetical protein